MQAWMVTAMTLQLLAVVGGIGIPSCGPVQHRGQRRGAVEAPDAGLGDVPDRSLGVADAPLGSSGTDDGTNIMRGTVPGIEGMTTKPHEGMGIVREQQQMQVRVPECSLGQLGHEDVAPGGAPRQAGYFQKPGSHLRERIPAFGEDARVLDRQRQGRTAGEGSEPVEERRPCPPRFALGALRASLRVTTACSHLAPSQTRQDRELTQVGNSALVGRISGCITADTPHIDTKRVCGLGEAHERHLTRSACRVACARR